MNWCPELGTVLANEEVRDGRSDIGGHPVVRMPLRQWMLKITAYADRLIDDLALVDWPEHIVKMQLDWIGRSIGARVFFPLADQSAGRVPARSSEGGESLEVYTTRPDTLFGATYMVLAPEHPLVEKITAPAQRAAVRAYVDAASRKSERVRIADAQDQDRRRHRRVRDQPRERRADPDLGRRLRARLLRHRRDHGRARADERDYEFAKTFGLPIVEVVAGGDPAVGPHEEDGVAVNSGFLNGLPTAEAKEKMTAWLEEHGVGKRAVSYKLRDWLFSRQRYWGEPFPVIHTDDGKVKLVPESELPVRLPELDDFKPHGGFEAAAGARDRLARDHRRRDRPARAPRHQHHAAVGGELLVLPALHRPAQRHGPVLARGRALLDERRPVRRRRGARGAAPAVRALLAQGALRPGPGAHQGAVPEAAQPRDDPGQELPHVPRRLDRLAEVLLARRRALRGRDGGPRRLGPGARRGVGRPRPGALEGRRGARAVGGRRSRGSDREDVQESRQRGQPRRGDRRVRRRLDAPLRDVHRTAEPRRALVDRRRAGRARASWAARTGW